MRKLVLAGLFVVAASLTIVAAGALAGGGGHGRLGASMNSYNEVVGGVSATDSGSVSTLGRGSLKLRVEDDGIHYRLRYSQMEGTVSQAHIHFAQQHVGGGIIAFLCAGTEAACTSPSGDISGVITPAEIIGPAEQGIEAGSFDEAVRAIRAGATYANVHSTPRFPAGEIRGQIGRGNKGRGGGDRK
jgi:hypothetical protein